MTDLLNILKEELRMMNEAKNILTYSFDKCTLIGIKESYSDEELESMDSLTSRFARLSDLIIQKIFKLIEKIDLDIEGTIRDSINRAEKKDLIDSAELFFEIRELRNNIAHEYIPSAYKEIFARVLELAPDLFDAVKRINKYCKEKYNL